MDALDANAVQGASRKDSLQRLPEHEQVQDDRVRLGQEDQIEVEV
jgi:hypothetical protein